MRSRQPLPRAAQAVEPGGMPTPPPPTLGKQTEGLGNGARPPPADCARGLGTGARPCRETTRWPRWTCRPQDLLSVPWASALTPDPRPPPQAAEPVPCVPPAHPQGWAGEALGSCTAPRGPVGCRPGSWGPGPTPQEAEAHAVLPAWGPQALALPAPTYLGPQAREEEGRRQPTSPSTPALSRPGADNSPNP